jgi:glycosyltransferase involved in cell wall biosynthesis
MSAPESALQRRPSLVRGRVSVVSIFFNEARFLAEAIESVLAQTYSEWELLLVDDGSTDGSTKIAKCYAALYPYSIRYLEHPGHANRGMSASRNLGLVHARGEFLLFLDGDDVVARTALEDQVTFMEAYPDVGTVYGPMRLWRSWDGSFHDRTVAADRTSELYLEPDRVHDQVTVLTTFLRHEDAVPSGNMMRTELVRKLGGFEEEFTGMYEDQVFRVKLCHVAPAYVSSRSWYYYRKHVDSCCAVMVVEGRVAPARARFLRWVKTYCRRSNVADPRIRRVLNRALRPYHYPRIAGWQTRWASIGRRWAWRFSNGTWRLVYALMPKPLWAFVRDIVRSIHPRRKKVSSHGGRAGFASASAAKMRLSE